MKAVTWPSLIPQRPSSALLLQCIPVFPGESRAPPMWLGTHHLAFSSANTSSLSASILVLCSCNGPPHESSLFWGMSSSAPNSFQPSPPAERSSWILSRPSIGSGGEPSTMVSSRLPNSPLPGQCKLVSILLGEI